MIVAVDPGVNNGAMVAVDGDVILAAAHWCRRSSADDVVFRWWVAPVGERAAAVGRLGHVRGAVHAMLGAYCARVIDELGSRHSSSSPPRLVVEDAYVGRDPRVALRTAKASGATAGRLEEALGYREATWSPAREWRSEAFGIAGNTKRDDAAAQLSMLMPGGVRGQVRHIAGIIGGEEHLLSAAGLALWRGGLRVIAKPKRPRLPRGG